MLTLLLVVLAQLGDPRTLAKNFETVTITNKVTVPRTGKISIDLFDMLHPDGYAIVPACEVKDLTEPKQHPPVGWVDEATTTKLMFHGFSIGHRLEYTCRGLMKRAHPLGKPTNVKGVEP